MEIDLLAADNPFERARKAWRAMGFVNNRPAQIGYLAEVFMAYQDFDRAVDATTPEGMSPRRAR